MSASSSGGRSVEVGRSDRVKAGDDGPGDELLNPLGERAGIRIWPDAVLREREQARDREERGRPESLGHLRGGVEGAFGLHREHGEIDVSHRILVCRTLDARAELGSRLLRPGFVPRADHDLVLAGRDQASRERATEAAGATENRDSTCHSR